MSGFSNWLSASDISEMRVELGLGLPSISRIDQILRNERKRLLEDGRCKKVGKRKNRYIYHYTVLVDVFNIPLDEILNKSIDDLWTGETLMPSTQYMFSLFRQIRATKEYLDSLVRIYQSLPHPPELDPLNPRQYMPHPDVFMRFRR